MILIQLYSHALLISAKSSHVALKFKSQLMQKHKLELRIPQLTLAQIAQLIRT